MSGRLTGCPLTINVKVQGKCGTSTAQHIIVIIILHMHAYDQFGMVTEDGTRASCRYNFGISIPRSRPISGALCPGQTLVLRRSRLVLLDEQPLLLLDHPPGRSSVIIQPFRYGATYFIISLMYSRRMFRESVSMLV